MATFVKSIRMTDELSERYARLADETGRTQAYYYTKALAEAIDRLEYEYGLLKDVEDWRAGRLETYTTDEVREHCGLGD